jgi:long-subunit fatty acid transport protein
MTHSFERIEPAPRWSRGAMSVVALLAWSAPARASGFDVTNLYSARHVGMGGTAVAWVRDPSALFHNPAGLAHTGTAAVIVNVSPLFGTVVGSPAAADTARGIESDPIFSTGFLAGGSVRIFDFLSVGLAFYPIAAAGATYSYDIPSGGGMAPVRDELVFQFVELSAGLAVNFDDTPIGAIRAGVGYRVTRAGLDREQELEATGQSPIDLSMSGYDFASFRLGLQVQPIEAIQLGVMYRTKMSTDISADEGTVLVPLSDLEAELVLPSRLTGGVRGDLAGFAASFQAEYGFQEENDSTTFSGTMAGGTELAVPALFRWENSLTLRTGFEYHGLSFDKIGRLAFRIGYVYDGQTTNARYPTAFGSPPAATNSFTGGAGFDGGPWEVNIAYAHQRGGVDNLQVPAEASAECPLCSFSGESSVSVNGLFLDFSWDFE